MMNYFQYLRHRPLLVLAILLVFIAFIILAVAAAKRYLRDEPFQLPEPIIANLFEHTRLVQKATNPPHF